MKRLLFAVCAALANPLVISPVTAQDGNLAASEAIEKHYALTLIVKSGDAAAEKARAAQLFPAHVVYQTQTDVIGKEVNLVRLGFFSSFDEAMAMKEKVIARFPNARATTVSAEEYRTVMAANRPKPEAAKPLPKAPPKAASPAPAPPVAWAITLASGSNAQLRATKPLPAALEQLRLYVASPAAGTGGLYRLNIGFFGSEQEARDNLRLLRNSYPQAKVIGVTAMEKAASEKSMVALPKRAEAVPVAATTVQAAPVPSAVEEQAERLMTEGRAALTAGNNAAAFRAFNQLLMLPPNRHSQEAQEFVGLARERAGEVAAAKREYELYLRLYPTGEGAERVRQRLANLAAPVARPQPLKAPKTKTASESRVYGSISQYYYHGASRIETTTTTAAATATDTFSNTDQSALVTNIDFNARYRNESFDNRFVFRDTNTQNFTDNPDRNRLNAAYFETRHRQLDYGARLGRQPGYSGGILGRFDGGLFSYRLLPKYRLDVSGGKPVEIQSDLDRTFYGINLDMGTFAERWSGAAYVISQEVDSIQDRQAVGGEVRYFDPTRSFFSLVDYDTSYSVLNTVLLVGTFQSLWNTTVNFTIDQRKTPAMQTSNALIGETVTSIRDLLQTVSEDEVRRYAEARTADASLYMAGVTRPVSQRWQVGFDIRYSNISATEAIGSVPATPSTGDIWMYTLQSIGTGLLTGRDSTVFAASFINGANYDGVSVSGTNRTLVGDRWAYDTALRWYSQEDDFGTKLTRFMPTFRVAYRWTERLSFEGEIGTERAQTDSASVTEKANRDFFYAGYRWDF